MGFVFVLQFMCAYIVIVCYDLKIRFSIRDDDLQPLNIEVPRDGRIGIYFLMQAVA